MSGYWKVFPSDRKPMSKRHWWSWRGKEEESHVVGGSFLQTKEISSIWSKFQETREKEYRKGENGKG